LPPVWKPFYELRSFLLQESIPQIPKSLFQSILINLYAQQKISVKFLSSPYSSSNLSFFVLATPARSPLYPQCIYHQNALGASLAQENICNHAPLLFSLGKMLFLFCRATLSFLVNFFSHFPKARFVF
jgi:hypothetical protein